jgi:phosphoribosylformylglycinamidine (FGAM) synthase-like amidotransferase family enzyme
MYIPVYIYIYILSAFHAAGLEAWDVNMNDLLTEKVTLSQFRGIVFCGGLIKKRFFYYYY